VGPTHVHRLVPLALAAAGLLVSGCGTERPEAAPAADASFSPAPTRTTSTPSPAATGALEGFPLDVGYDEENGDDHSPVRVTGRPATTAFDLCGLPTWDPQAGTTDVLGVEWRGEAEWSRGRTLVLYPSAHEAAAAVTTANDALTGCPDESGEPGYGTAHTVLHQALGEQSVAWTDTYWFESDGDRLFGTGLTVYHLVRVGRAVLLAYAYGEGNGSEESRANSIARATELEHPVVSRMDVVG
jgi:hypothetical protein